MHKVFCIDGGAGRVIAAIPALEKYVLDHPEEKVSIVVFGWKFLLDGNPLLQNLVYDSNQKNLFFDVYLNCDEVVTPEPYRLPDYFRQKLSLCEAFNVIINNNCDPKDHPPLHLHTSKVEKITALNILSDVKKAQQKNKTIVIQPFGRSIRKEGNYLIDESSRSLNVDSYLKIVNKLSKNYNLILFAEPWLFLEQDTVTFKVEMDLRNWMGVIEQCDYFLGVDSVGQHIARAFNKPGAVILGSTFAKNVSYPDWFATIEKQDVKKHYSPIRLSEYDAHLADKLNDENMNFTETEIEEIVTLLTSLVEKI